MRSPAEIKFRLRQESANLYLAMAKPRLSETELAEAPARLRLPEPHSCAGAARGSLFEFTVIATAKSVLSHRFPLLGTVLETGPRIEWRRDYAHGKVSPARYFRLVPYLNFAAVGDHKFIWELNRHQHLVLLAQAHLFSGDPTFLTEVFAQLESWLEQNPFQRGINWASALEVAFRTLSWIWLWHFCGGAMPEPLRARFFTALYQHGRHLHENLSVYFSPNTHLLGEAVALHALGTLFPSLPNAQSWQRRGAELVEAQLAFQVKTDGAHFEQSSYYHVYALDFFLFYYLLAEKPRRLEAALIRMAEHLHWLLGPARRIAFFGDDDGGRLFHPQGRRDEFGRATLATCGVLFAREDWAGSPEDLNEQALWWLGPQSATGATASPRGSKLFADAGAAFLQSRELYVQIDAGLFGWGGAGHSHADTLSLVAWHNGEVVLSDPGTYTYIGDPVERDRFRGTRMHNTVTIDGQNQADPAGPFRWNNKPAVRLQAFSQTAEGGIVDAVCEYRGFRHRRRIQLRAQQLLVLDEVDGPPGEHLVEQVWNLGPTAGEVHMTYSHPAVQESSEHSAAFGVKTASATYVAKARGQMPISIAMCLNTRHKAEITVAQAAQMFDNEVTNMQS